MKSILGKKIGMTQISDEGGSVAPVAVVEAGSMVVAQTETKEKEGYNVTQAGYTEKKEEHVNQPMRGHLGKTGILFKKRLKKFKINDDERFNLGDGIKLDIFQDGDVVGVIGVLESKGTQGAIARYNCLGGPMGYGSKSHKIVGTRNAESYPAGVFRGRKGSGEIGHDRATIQNLKIVKVDNKRNLFLIRGAVPENKGGAVIVREAIRSE